MRSAVRCQALLLAYHQITTLVDLYPFNGVRNSSTAERLAEAGVNAALMSLAPIGFLFGIRSLMLYGVVYYFVLFFFELIIWWIPYFTPPQGPWLALYTLALAVATTNFGRKGALADWSARHARIHRGTFTPLKPGAGPILPNLEHIILHGWTALTALVTLGAFRALASR